MLARKHLGDGREGRGDSADDVVDCRGDVLHVRLGVDLCVPCRGGEL